MQKFGQGLVRSLCEAQFTQPGGVVGEVDVGSDVLSARIGIDVGSGESLMQEISTQRAVWPAMVEPGKFVAVVDGEHGAAFPMRRPLVQPVAHAGVELAALAICEGGVTQCAVVGGIESVWVQLLGHPDLQPALLGGAPLHEGGGKGVEEFVVIDMSVAARTGEGGFEILVPAHFVAKPLLLLCAEHVLHKHFCLVAPMCQGHLHSG